MKPTSVPGASGRVAVVTLALGLVCEIASAQSPASYLAIGASTELGMALERTRSQGVPTVAISSTADAADSRSLYRAVVDSAWARESRGLVQVVELPAGMASPNPQGPGLPSVTVYAAGPSGIVCHGRKAVGSAAEAVAWLGSLGLTPGRVVADPALVRANHSGGLPSGQAPQPMAPQPLAPQVAPPATPATAQAPVFAPQPAQTMMMMVPQAAPATTSVVQMPSQNIMVQPGETRFFMASPAPGAAFVPQQVAAPAPTMMMVAQPTAPAAPSANLFLPVAAPAAQPAVAAPSAFVASPPAVAATAPMGVAAVTNQSLSLGTSASRTRVRVRGPGPIRAGLASFGERLTRLGRASIETIQETEFTTPMSQGTGGGIATFSSTTAAPISAPPAQTLTVPQAAPAPQPQPQPPYEAPSASPQTATPASKQGFFHRK